MLEEGEEVGRERVEEKSGGGVEAGENKDQDGVRKKGK